MPASWEHINYVLDLLKLQILTLMGREPLCPRALLSHCLWVQKGLLWYEILSASRWSISFKERLEPQPEIITDTSIKHQVSIFRMAHSTKDPPWITVKGSNLSGAGSVATIPLPSVPFFSSKYVTLLFSALFQQYTEHFCFILMKGGIVLTWRWNGLALHLLGSRKGSREIHQEPTVHYQDAILNWS